MATRAYQRHLEKPAFDSSLLCGVTLWRWDDGDSSPHKFIFKTDSEGFYLYARSDEDASKPAVIWDLALVSDVRQGKLPKDQKLCEAISVATGVDPLTEDCCLDLVYRRDGIVHLTRSNLVAENASVAAAFRKSVNLLAHHQQDNHASLGTYIRKYHTKVLLHADSHDRVSLKVLSNLMMQPRGSRAVSQYFMSSREMELDTDDSGSQFVAVKNLSEEVFLGLINYLLNNRSSDIEVLQRIINLKSNKPCMNVAEFLNFLNHTQRNPHLNEALHPLTTTEQAVGLIEKYGNSPERLNLDQLLSYLASEDNMVLDLEVVRQHMDMNQPLNHYFINTSHNTYLNGHQLRSESLTEMYIQTLLLGCRCVELDCWPTGDLQDIIITHGKTLCTQVSFKEVLEAINEYAFVTSSYPLILSVENHCTRYPQLLARMANLFTSVFGDKLVAEPLPGHQVSIARMSVSCLVSTDHNDR